jgi:hypothetical protein
MSSPFYNGIEDQSILRLIRCLSVCVCVCVCGIVKINVLTIVGLQMLSPNIDMKSEIRSAAYCLE